MAKTESRPGDKSLVFEAPIGSTWRAGDFAKRDYLIDPRRFDSEGNWAFCRFNNPDMPAARMGFQRGGYNGGTGDMAIDPSLLQLHLELMTKEGAILWLPTGRFKAQDVITDAGKMDIRLEHEGREIFSMRGWPHIACHFQSDDGDAEATLEFRLNTVSVLPDCLLPRCVFAMWESMGEARGTVRYKGRATAVEGKVFFDHPRVIHPVHEISKRQMYVYTTMYFEDGGGMYGYHTIDSVGRPMDYYCFGIYVDPEGRGHFLADAQCTGLTFDSDHIPERWHLRWGNGDVLVEADIAAQHHEIVRSWGAANVPVKRKEYSIMALVLEGSGKITQGGRGKPVRGWGLAEYYDVDYWPLPREG